MYVFAFLARRPSSRISAIVQSFWNRKPERNRERYVFLRSVTLLPKRNSREAAFSRVYKNQLKSFNPSRTESNIYSFRSKSVCPSTVSRYKECWKRAERKELYFPFVLNAFSPTKIPRYQACWPPEGKAILIYIFTHIAREGNGKQYWYLFPLILFPSYFKRVAHIKYRVRSRNS